MLFLCLLRESWVVVLWFTDKVYCITWFCILTRPYSLEVNTTWPCCTVLLCVADLVCWNSVEDFCSLCAFTEVCSTVWAAAHCGTCSTPAWEDRVLCCCWGVCWACLLLFWAKAFASVCIFPVPAQTSDICLRRSVHFVEE